MSKKIERAESMTNCGKATKVTNQFVESTKEICKIICYKVSFVYVAYLFVKLTDFFVTAILQTGLQVTFLQIGV